MQKIKKLSALLLAVVLMLVVMTGCGGGYGPVDGRTMFVNRVNQARRENYRSTLARHAELDEAAEYGVELYTTYLDGKITMSELLADRNKVLNTYGSDGECTYMDWFNVSSDDYYSGSYKIAPGDNIRTVRGDYIGVYAVSYRGMVRVCVIIVDMY